MEIIESILLLADELHYSKEMKLQIKNILLNDFHQARYIIYQMISLHEDNFNQNLAEFGSITNSTGQKYLALRKNHNMIQERITSCYKSIISIEKKYEH